MWFWQRKRANCLLNDHQNEIRIYIRNRIRYEIQYSISSDYKPSPEDIERWKKEREKRAEEEAKRIPFRTLVLQKMEELDLDAQTLYKRAGIDRKLFSKLKTDLDYRPNKNTAIRYCLGFRLNEGETDEWMKSAGFWLSDTSAFDLAIRYCIDRKIYDPIDVNILLEALKIPLLK